MNDLERAQFTRTNFCYRVPSVFAAGADDLENLSAGQYCELDIWSDGRETSDQLDGIDLHARLLRFHDVGRNEDLHDVRETPASV